jgi:hypothetical protein
VGIDLIRGAEDRSLLEFIQRVLGGGYIIPVELSWKMENAWCFKSDKRPVVIRLVHCINGYLHSPKKLRNFQKVCIALGVKVQKFR